MNRSILIVICDFLLLSLLTFSTDINHMADENTPPPTKVVLATNAVANANNDLAAAMKLALEEERKSQTQLQKELAAANESVTQQQAQLNRRAQENTRLQQQQAGLQQKYAAAQTNLENLNRQLQSNSAQAQLSQQKIAATQAEAKKQSDLAAALKKQLDDFARSNQLAQAEQQRLAHQLQLAEAQRKSADERAGLMQQEVQSVRTENTRLAEGLKALATNSSELTKEIRDNRPLAPNTLFSQFITNRVLAGIFARRTGFLGMDASKNKSAHMLLVTDGTNIFAICHVQDTPFTLWDPGTDWDGLTGTISGHNPAQIDIRSLSFDQRDPRVVFIPVSAADAQKLGGAIYRISTDPYKFQDAVLIGMNGDYYGECSFQIDTSTPQYMKFDHSILGGLFGKFNPSRGDVVLSRTGELLGIMVNNTYCLMLKDFKPMATIQFGADVRDQHTGATFSKLFGYVFQLPQRLQ